MRPSMSSDTPSFKLSPVNSTLVCKLVSDCHPTPHAAFVFAYLLHIDAGGAFEDLFRLRQHLLQETLTGSTVSKYLDDGSVTYPS